MKRWLFVQDSSVECEKFKEVIKRSGILLTERSKSDFNMKNIEQDMKRLIKINKRYAKLFFLYCHIPKTIKEHTCTSYI